MKYVNLTTTYPLTHADIICIHDASLFEIGRMFMHSVYGLFGTIWKMMLCFIAKWSADRILTVSEYSKSKLNKFLVFL